MAENIPSLDDLLKNIRDEDKPKSSSALAVIPKKPKDLVEEDIDSRILSILGLEDIFDLTYEEYSSLLKEASIKGRMPGSKMTTESVQLVTDEYRRVKEKTGRFKVNKKKIDINKVLNRKPPAPPGAIVKKTGLVSPIVSPIQDVADGVKESQRLEGDLINGLGSILDSLIVIRTILQNQNKIQSKSIEGEKKNTERQKRKEREKRLEGKATVTSKEESKLRAPVTGFFDAIKRFITNVLLGSVVLGLFKWLKNPVNKRTIKDFTDFLTDNAPLILGGLLAIATLPIASSLLGLTGAVLGGIPSLIGALGFFATPAGLAALAAAAGVGLAAAAEKFVKPRLQTLRGGEGKTKSGIVFEYGDVVDLRNKQQEFLTQSGISGESAQQQLKKFDDVQRSMFEQKRINDELADVKKNLKRRQEEYEGLGGDKVNTPINRSLKAEIKRLKKIEKDKENEKLFAQKRVTETFQKLQITDEDLMRLRKEKGRPVERIVSSSSTSRFAGARDREALKASKITDNAPISIGEKAGYSTSRGRIHAGRDIAAPSGTGLQVPSDAIITDKGVDSGYGNYIVFRDSNGIEHLYGHMLEASPYNKGDQIPAGTVIGRVGSTGRSSGPHLHWEVSRVMGEVGRPRQNIIDPLEIGFPAQAPFTGKVEAAKLAPSAPTVPSIPSPTGGNIAMLPLPIGLGQQPQGQSNSAPLQTPVPSFSSEDPNNMTTLVVKAIYNVVG